LIELWHVGFIAGAYLLGSIPFALIAGKVRKGIDIRQVGSGNTGAANVLRAVGWQAAALVFLADAGKAIAPVLFLRAVANPPLPLLEVIGAMAAIAGHNWPVFLRFKGGKGVSSSFGVLLVISPVAGAIALVVFVAIVAVTRYISLGSMASSCVGATILLFQAYVSANHSTEPLFALSSPWYALLALIAPVIIVQHRENITRLLNGQERKLGQLTG
jgi:acyl phosphate:glycerol-3-phosphate acyltransferase